MRLSRPEPLAYGTRSTRWASRHRSSALESMPQGVLTLVCLWTQAARKVRWSAWALSTESRTLHGPWPMRHSCRMITTTPIGHSEHHRFAAEIVEPWCLAVRPFSAPASAMSKRSGWLVESIVTYEANPVNGAGSWGDRTRINPASEMVWWGARHGRVVTHAVRSPVQAGDAVDARGLNGLGEGHRRQDGGEPPGQHRRARPRGAEQAADYGQNACITFSFSLAAMGCRWSAPLTRSRGPEPR